MSDEQHSRHAMTSTRAEAIAAYLEGEGVSYELVEHEPAMSATAEAKIAGLPPEEIAKTIVLHDGAAYVVVTLPASNRLDMHKLRELLGATRHLRLATESEMERDFPALEVGAAPPFGPMMPAAEVIDSALMRHDRVLCLAGDHRHSVLIDPREIVRVTAAETTDISGEE